jgi:hypothetical protein
MGHPLDPSHMRGTSLEPLRQLFMVDPRGSPGEHAPFEGAQTGMVGAPPTGQSGVHDHPLDMRWTAVEAAPDFSSGNSRRAQAEHRPF